MTETTQPYTKTLTAFNGADLIFLINDRAVGSISEIKYTESLFDFMSNPSTGVIEATFFGRSEVKNALTGDDTLRVLMKNEYGQSALMRFNNFRATTCRGGAAIDDVVMNEYIDFTFTRICYSDEPFAYDLHEDKYIFGDDALKLLIDDEEEFEWRPEVSD